MSAHAEPTRTRDAVRVVRDAGSGRSSISLAEADPEFSEVIPPDERALAAAVRLPLVELPAGGWLGPDAGDDRIGSLVVSGLVVRTLHRYGRPNVEFYGLGDLIGAAASEEGTSSWKVVQETALVVLGAHFELAARRWPALWRVTLERHSQRAERLAAHGAALQLSRVDERLEALLWQLADRFGKVTRDGIVVPLPFTHRVLGFLAAAKRPTVSVALSELAEQGRVVRLDEGSWLLRRPAYGPDRAGTERGGHAR